MLAGNGRQPAGARLRPAARIGIGKRISARRQRATRVTGPAPARPASVPPRALAAAARAAPASLRAISVPRCISIKNYQGK